MTSSLVMRMQPDEAALVGTVYAIQGILVALVKVQRARP
jgi:hypothetical protein